MSERVEKLLNGMTLDQKIGQMFCLGFCGTYPYPDIMEMIEKYHVAGFRVTPQARKFVRYLGPDHPGCRRVERPPEYNERRVGSGCGVPVLTPREYAEVLNTLRLRSIETGAGIPLYFSLDFEGNGKADVTGANIWGVPHPMGLAASGDKELTRQVGRLVGRQLKAVGVDWVHSPDMDVNTDPANPEIGTRSFSPDPSVCGEFGLQMFLGYRDSNLVATGKHFPGRGHSSKDAHYDVPMIEESGARMREVHLAPYKKLIEQGLPCIMLAHSVYPALDPTGEISTLSKPIVTGVLREELGFDRVIITDSFTMGGLVARYEVPEAAVRAFEAGVDLLLLKDENALRREVFAAVFDAVHKGRISEEQVEQSVRRVLDVKEEYGLLDAEDCIVDLDKVDEVLATPESREIARESSRRTVVTLRSGDALPLKEGARILVAEETVGGRSSQTHCGYLYEALLERGADVRFVDWDRKDGIERALPVIEGMAAESDVIVFTGYYSRQEGCGREMYQRLASMGKPVIAVVNAPYDLIVDPSWKNVIVHFNPVTFSMQKIADIMLGKESAEAELAFDPAEDY